MDREDGPRETDVCQPRTCSRQRRERVAGPQPPPGQRAVTPGAGRSDPRVGAQRGRAWGRWGEAKVVLGERSSPTKERCGPRGAQAPAAGGQTGHTVPKTWRGKICINHASYARMPPPIMALLGPSRPAPVYLHYHASSVCMLPPHRSPYLVSFTPPRSLIGGRLSRAPPLCIKCRTGGWPRRGDRRERRDWAAEALPPLPP